MSYGEIEMGVDVVVDSRETRSETAEKYRSHPDVDSTVVDMMDVGDIVINAEVVFERKTIGDFVGSIKNRRLESQIEKMYDMFGAEKSYLVVEGDYSDFEYLPYSSFSPKSVYGYIGTISARWQMVPLFVSDQDKLVDITTRIARKHSEQTSRVVRDPVSAPSRAKDDFFARAVLQFSGVGKSKIDPLREEFGTFEELSKASVDELVEIDGIGSTTAEGILEQLGRKL